MITIEIAGIPIGIDNRYDFRRRMLPYITEKAPVFTVFVTDEELEAERGSESHPSEYLEFICAYRKIAEQLPAYDAFVFHGAAVALDGQAYLFTAPSGTGKTTHVNLWLKRFHGSWVLNGDKPVIRRIDGRFCVCGTPWQGKERLGFPMIRPVAGVCLLHRGVENSIKPVTGQELAVFVMHQVYLPKDPERLTEFLSLLDEFFRAVPTYSMRCNMDVSAAELSYETMRRGAVAAD